MDTIKLKEDIRLPRVYRDDIRRAVTILKTAGCNQIFLFGSLATGQVREDTDIDLAIRGCPEGNFFHLLGQLMLELDHPVDLISLDDDVPFARFLEKEGEMVRIG